MDSAFHSAVDNPTHQETIMNSKKFSFAALRVPAGALMVGALLTMGVAASAEAADFDAAPSITVKYSDLDLASPAGAKALYRRIVAAALNVCPTEDGRTLHFVALAEQCRSEAIERAVRSVDNTQLAMIYAASSKRG
jgi:UrcA family protein